MILATDVQYHDTGATAAGVLFHDWSDGSAEEIILTEIPEVAPYVPGQFYQRELPCLLALLKAVDPELDCIVVDGFVYLDGDEKPGLGKYFYDALDGRVPVIGVAKSAFKASPPETALYRGSRHGKPVILAVTAGAMHRAGCIFYCSENGVWLLSTHHLPGQMY